MGCINNVGGNRIVVSRVFWTNRPTRDVNLLKHCRAYIGLSLLTVCMSAKYDPVLDILGALCLGCCRYLWYM